MTQTEMPLKKTERFKNKLIKFYLGRAYPLFCALLIFLGHSTGWDLAFASVLLVSVMLGLWLCDDLRFAILPFCATFFIVTLEHGPGPQNGFVNYYLQKPVLIWMGCMLVLLIASFVAFMIRNRYRAKRLPGRRLYISMIIFCAALLTNGLFSKNYTVSNLVFVLGMIGLLLGVYALFAAFVRFDETAFDYFMFCLVVTGLLLCAQLLFAYFTTVCYEVDGSVIKDSLLFGWGSWTTFGCMLVMLMPACFYFAYGHKRGWIGFWLGILEYVCVFLCQSRGALLFGSVILAACLAILLFKGGNCKQNRMFILGLVIVGGIGVAVLFNKIWLVLENYVRDGFDDHGRYEIWRIGIGKFLESPIFGTGFYDSGVQTTWQLNMYPYMFHNTVLQLLASCGVVGFLGYSWHRLMTIRLVLVKPNAGKSFLGLCVAGLLIFSLLDTIFFNTYPMIFYALMLLFMEKSTVE